MVMFNPSSSGSSLDGKTRVSAVHAILSPFLERLTEPGVDAKTIRRVKECLTRVVTGFTRNPSVRAEELLPFVYATVEPFISKHEIESVLGDGSTSDDEDALDPINVSGSTNLSTGADPRSTTAKKGTVVEWRPSFLKSAKTKKAALRNKSKDELDTKRCRDGASAPKLTGSYRHSFSSRPSKSSVNNPATITAVTFGLQLLSSSLKRLAQQDKADTATMLDPFLPLLTTCACVCRDSDVLLLAFRCIGILLRCDLPSLERCSMSLAAKTLELLSSSGVLSNLNPELVHASFKMLTYLISMNRPTLMNKQANERNDAKSLPLDDEQMQVLISFLQGSLVDSDHHNPAIGLVKAITSHQFMSPEFYDLMETVLDQSVRSPRAALRQECGGIFVNYLLNYPMAQERFEQHVKQAVLNVAYDHEEGRLSAISLTATIVEKLPLPVLEKHSQVFFLPLTLQLVNDDSNECRHAVAKCLSQILERVSTETLKSLYNYVDRWGSQQDATLQRTALQLYGIFIETRGDFLKRGDTLAMLVEKLQHMLETCNDWETTYFTLICLEKLSVQYEKCWVSRTELWSLIIDCLGNDHPWVRLSSARIVAAHLTSLDVETFTRNECGTFVTKLPGSLYDVARKFCFLLGVDEHEQDEDLNALAIKSLTWIIQAMKRYPDLCYADEELQKESDPVLWLMTRLSNIAKPKGTKRRQAVFKCFAAFATVCGSIVFAHLELMLEPLHRSETEGYNELELATMHRVDRPADASLSSEAQMAKDVLHLLEERCDSPDHFLRSYGAVKERARTKKEERKLLAKAEAVRDPQTAAKRKIRKQESEKKRRKRRIEERRRDRGANGAKRQRLRG